MFLREDALLKPTKYKYFADVVGSGGQQPFIVKDIVENYLKAEVSDQGTHKMNINNFRAYVGNNGILADFGFRGCFLGFSINE